MARRRLFQFPVKWVTDENVRRVITGDARFGPRSDSFHRGADIGENAGEAIYSIAAGTVYDWGYDDEAGNYVIIQHDEASYSYYLHMAGRSNYDAGQPVGLNDVIGYVGSTGWSTGPHIHFAVSGVPNWSGWVDPVQYVLDRYWYDDGQPDCTSHLNAAQQDQLAGWIGQTYGARQYWSDVQAISRDRGWYDGAIDGIPGPLTFDAEQRLWADVFDRPALEPVPEPIPEPDPVKPEPVDPVKPEYPKPVPRPEPIEEAPVTAPPYTTPGPPDVILARKPRGALLLGSWILGTAIGAANVGYIYAVEQGIADYPVWLGIATAVYGFLAAQLNGLARANLNPKG